MTIVKSVNVQYSKGFSSTASLSPLNHIQNNSFNKKVKSPTKDTFYSLEIEGKVPRGGGKVTFPVPSNVYIYFLLQHSAVVVFETSLHDWVIAL